MRIITGLAKGMPLKSLSGSDTRPTSDKVKEAMFSAVQFDVSGAVVLDLFAGSGQLGIEALSRGATKAYFVDNNPKAIAIVRENLHKTRFDSNETSQVDRLPYAAFLRLVKTKFNIAFVDSPYNKGIVGKVLPLLIPRMESDSVIICEHEKELILPQLIDGFEIEKVYNYGTINITIYRN